MAETADFQGTMDNGSQPECTEVKTLSVIESLPEMKNLEQSHDNRYEPTSESEETLLSVHNADTKDEDSLSEQSNIQNRDFKGEKCPAMQPDVHNRNSMGIEVPTDQSHVQNQGSMEDESLSGHSHEHCSDFFHEEAPNSSEQDQQAVRTDCVAGSNAIAKLREAHTYDEKEDYYSEANQEAYYSAREKYEFFWHGHSIYSQWHSAGFRIDGRYFRCAEQYMMYGKAVVFKDFPTARKILRSKDPKDMKALGRKVQNFDPAIWMIYCLYIVKEANKAKFSQNEELRGAILATFPKILVEASPLDRIWGIGLAEEDPLAWDEENWQGTNFLGYVLTEVRDEILAESDHKFEGGKNYIKRLLKNANMTEEQIDNTDPNGWKPTQDEEEELKLRDGHKGHFGKRGENHRQNKGSHDTTNEEYMGADQDEGTGAKSRKTEHMERGQSGRERYGKDNQASHRQRNNNNNRGDGPDAENWRNTNNKKNFEGRGHGGGGGNSARGYNQHAQGRGYGREYGGQSGPEGPSERDNFEYFWGQDNFYSQWYHTEFTVENQRFNCAEQYMMYKKAVLFQDQEIAGQILRTNDQMKMKKLGREVRGFDEGTWQKHSLQYVKEGNLAKFSANEKLYRVISKTHPKILVEASPYDKIWGIGLEAHDERAWRKSTWRGSNFLGYILTEVRDELMAKNGHINATAMQIFLPDLQKQYAAAVQNSQASRDKTGGWSRYDNKDWRAKPNQDMQQIQDDPPMQTRNQSQSRQVPYGQTSQRADQQRSEQAPSGGHYDHFTDGKNFNTADGKALHDTSDTPVMHPTIPGLVIQETQPKQKKKKGKKDKEETRTKTPEKWDANDDDFELPPAMLDPEKKSSEMETRVQDKGKGKKGNQEDGWEKVKGKKKGGKNQETTRSEDGQAGKQNKSKVGVDKHNPPSTSNSKDQHGSRKANKSSGAEKLANLSMEDDGSEEVSSHETTPERTRQEKGGNDASGSQQQLSARQKKNQRKKNK